MDSAREKILVIEGDEASRQSLLKLLQGSGYEVSATGSGEEGFQVVREIGVDLLLLDANLAGMDCCPLLPELKGSAATEGIRVILLSSGGASERARGLDLGADDVISRPWEAEELLARVRAQLRQKRAQDELREKTRIAEEGRQIAHTAFQALAVTEKMTRDAFSLGRALKVGLAAVFVVAAVMAAIFFLYRGRAEKETRRAYAVITQLERGMMGQESLIERTRRMREEMERSAAQRPDDARTQLRPTETEGKTAQDIIHSYAPSVCLLHVVVAFRHKAGGKRLRYAGINPQGEPLQDSEGNPVFDLEGRGPEVRADFFGTGFLAAADGRILTNRHVVEPWWQNAELGSIAKEGFEPVIAEISAYFPDVPRALRVEILKTSPEADLSVVQGSLEVLNRAVIPLDGRSEAAVSGEPVVLMGYATGLDAILARAGEETVSAIVASSNGNPKQIMAELAQRSLIRPLVTQGHIGDVLTDKIVFDAQTTAGGSGGPLFNQEGKVIGVNFAVIRGFGGSNFGIPIRYAEPLLSR